MMLVELFVQNLVIVEQAVLRPGRGLTVISGETGAGKSLLMDALKLLCGERAQSQMLGPRGESCLVVGVFRAVGTSVADVLDQHGLSQEEDLLIRRQLRRSGRSQAWINDVPVSLGVLRDIASRLIEVRGQHEQLKLADARWQCAALDAWAGLEDLREAYRQEHQRVLDCEAALQELLDRPDGSARERDYLRFLAKELADFEPQAGELTALEQDQQELAGIEEWQALAAELVAELIDGDASMVSRLGALLRRLAQAPEARFADITELCSQATENLREAGMAATAVQDSLHADPEKAQRIEERLKGWHDLLRKHGGNEEAVLQAWEDIDSRLYELDHLDERRAALEADCAAARGQREQQGLALAKARSKAFKRFAKALCGELAELGLPKVHCTLVDGQQPKPDAKAYIPQSIHIQTNPGIAPGPIGSLASGGEIARIALAFAVLLAEQEEVPVLVFDEIDSGIGARLGDIVAEKLRAVAAQRSVLVITHTARVAAAADHHYQIKKEQGSDNTRVQVLALDGQERVEELCAMMGGDPSAVAQVRGWLDHRPKAS